MKRRHIPSIFPAICFVAFLLIAPNANAQTTDKKLKIVLAGDSTVTAHSGWGQGFSELLNDNVECVNLAQGGRSSRSFRTEGWWIKCLEAQPDFLLIQFGHNDQPGKGPERESDAKTDFRDHLRGFVNESRRAGIKPILVTSLTRRRWTADGKIDASLSDYAEATRIVANELEVPLVDLHKLSIEHCQLIGPTAYRAFEPMNEQGADHTHLNTEGSRAVATLIAGSISDTTPELAHVFNQEKLLAYRIRNGSTTNETSGRLQLEETKATIQIRLNGKSVLTYNKVSPPLPDEIAPIYQRSGFLHPVASPSGLVVTDNFPADHAHQNGIFTAWVTTRWNDRKIDFWNLAAGTGRVSHQRVVSTFTETDKIGFVVDLVHTAEEKPIVDILRDRWKVTVWQTDGAFHMFDLETTQSALTDFPLLIEEYHYGGLGFRGPVRWLSEKERAAEQDLKPNTTREPFEFVNSEGANRVQGNGQPTRWVTASGQIDGKPVAITVLCHEDNFRSPQTARLHPSKPYFAYSPCIMGPFTIDKQHEYTANYRYLVTDSAPDSAWINVQWNQWHER